MPLLGIAVYKNRSLGTAVYRLLEMHFPTLFHTASALSAPFGHLPLEGKAVKVSGRTFLAPHRGSSPMGLCKRTGFLGVTRRENPVRRHFERSEMRGLRSGVAGKCWNIDSIGLFNIARYTAGIPLFPSALPPKREARRYVANDFLNLIAFPRGEGCDTRIPSSKKGGEAAT